MLRSLVHACSGCRENPVRHQQSARFEAGQDAQRPGELLRPAVPSALWGGAALSPLPGRAYHGCLEDPLTAAVHDWLTGR